MKKRFVQLFLIVLIASVVQPAIAQNRSGQTQQQSAGISGTITDNQGQPLTGVAVYNSANKAYAVSDSEGRYSIKATNGDKIVFSLIGMKEISTVVENSRIVDMIMQNDTIALEEAVVTGYQTISKERATGSFSVLSSTALTENLQPNIIDRIEGKVAGLNIITNGSSKTIQIRGVSTINGNRNPLFVVDGVPFEGEPGDGGDNTTPLDLISPADIVNITVLKDATAASIYGARSANGVIVITTRNGQQGKTRVNYSGTVSFQGLPDREYSHLMSSSELVDYQLMVQATSNKLTRKAANSFQNPVQTLMLDLKEGKISQTQFEAGLQPYRNQDRYDQVVDEFLRKQKVQHQHNLSFNGGSDIYKYNVSFNYTGDAPYEKAQYINRLGFNIKNTFDFFKWLSVDAGIMGSQKTADYDCGTLGMSLLDAGGASYYMLRDENGDPCTFYDTKSQKELDRLTSLGLNDEARKPVEQLNRRHYSSKSNYLNLNFAARFKIIEGLNASLRYQRETTTGYNKDYSSKDYYTVAQMVNDATVLKADGTVTHYVPAGGQVVQNNIDNWSSTARAQIDFDRNISKNSNLMVIAGGEIRKVVTTSNGFYFLGYDDETLAHTKFDELSLSTAKTGTQSLNGYFYQSNWPILQNGTPPTTYVDNRYVSFYANASWQWNQRLTLSGSIRMDQSNLFGTDPKYQYRPLWSVGAQYVVLSDYNWVDKLTVRATYGINGNIPKLNGPYLIAEVGGSNYYTNEPTMYIASPPNNMLRWEKTNVFNLGLDFDLFQGRLGGSVDFYNKATSDLLGPYSLDPTLGWSSLDINFGSMVNRGVEVTLNSVNIKSKNWRWTTDFTFSYNKNEITDIETTSESASSYYSGLNNRVGYPMGALFSVKFKGLNENGAPVAYLADGSETLNYSALTKDDLVYSGTYVPPFNASLANTVSWKGLDLSFMFVYVGGHVMRDIAASYVITSHPVYAVSNTRKEMANYWKQPGDELKEDCNPAYMFQTTTRNGQYIWQAADKHIQKGDFIKLRNISLSYNLPARLTKNSAISSAKITAQARNLWWWAANKSNLDPEIWVGSSTSPSRGTLYPAEFTLGLNLNF
ncbi:MAG: SusC/RagA family TonB-linked outer membrane protein [Bacteroidales bacterium]|nr:SusC/RagA family TonB-linked outer membrane protein [Bacteroidales bacterium]